MRTDFIGKIPLCLHLNLCCYRMASSWAPREYWQRFTRYVTCGTCTCWTVLDPPPLKNWEWCVLGPSMLKLFRKWCCDVVMCFFRKLWYMIYSNYTSRWSMLLQILGFSPLPSKTHHQAYDILARESQWNPSTFICHCHPGWGIRLDLDPANTPRIPPWRSKPVNSGPAVGSPGNLSTGALQTGNTRGWCKSKIEPLLQKVPSEKEDFGWNVHQKACLGTVYCVYWTQC